MTTSKVPAGAGRPLEIARGPVVLLLDVVAALAAFGALMMLIVGVVVGQGQWIFSLPPALVAAGCFWAVRLYDAALQRSGSLTA